MTDDPTQRLQALQARRTATRRHPAAASRIVALGLSTTATLAMVATMAHASAGASTAEAAPLAAAAAASPAGGTPTVRLVLPDGRVIEAVATADGLVAVVPADAVTAGTLPPVAQQAASAVTVPAAPQVVAPAPKAKTKSRGS